MKYLKLILALLLGFGMVNGKYIAFTNATGSVEVKAKSATSTGLELSVVVPGVEVSTESTEKGDFAVLKLGDYGYTTEIGKPALPAITKLIEVPIGADVKVDIIDRKEGSMFLTARVKPLQPSIPKIPNPEVKFEFDEDFYATNAFYPEKPVVVKEAGIVRGHRLVSVTVYPISYNPATGQIRYISSLDLRITFEGGNIGETQSRIYHHYTEAFERKLRKTILNYGVFERGKPALTLPIDYLFIVPDDWVDDIEPLVDLKKFQGYRTIVAPLSQTGNTTDAIKSYIQQLYDDPTRNLTFVQLVGDVEQIPNWTGQASGNPATDLYYTTLEGDDYFPDVYIGRLSVQNETQLATVVQKITRYEMVDNWTNGTSWAGIAYFMASNDGSFHQVAESTHVYSMRLVERHGMQTDSLWYYYNSGTPVAQAINSGRSLSIYSGHGGETAWAGPPFNISDVYALQNVDMLTHVESYACVTGSYTMGECFMEAWLRAPNGAITAMGSSVTSYWDEDDILQRRIFDEWFDSTYYWVAGNIVEGKIELYVHYSGGGRTQRYFEMYNLFGDPSTDIFTLPPVTPVVNVPGAIPIAPSQVPVYVERDGAPLELALVTFIQNDSIVGQGYTDQTGNAYIQVYPISGGPVEVHVIGHNIVPYSTSIVAVSEGAYIGFLRDSLANDPNGNGVLDAGEQADLFVMAKNFGNDNASAVYAILSTADSFVTVVSDSVFYGNINAGDSLWSPVPFVINASVNTPDQHVALFSIEFHDANDSVWTSNFSITVNAPLVHFYGYSVVDTVGGNGNGVAEPGETVMVYVSLENSGHTALANVSGVLSTADPYITLIDSVADFGTMQPGDVVQSASPYIVYIDDSCPAPSFPLLNIAITGDGGFSFADSFKLIVGRVGLFYDVEGDTTGWEHGGDNDLWHVSTRDYHSPGHSFYSGSEAGGQYTNNMDAWLKTPIVVLGENATLSFWTKYEFESCCDFGYVEISTDGGSSWNSLTRLSGSSDWTRVELDLSSIPIGTVVYIRFRHTSDGSIVREGWYVDDIAVTPPSIPPILSLTSLDVQDSTGNNNGILDPGETITLLVGLRNDGERGVTDLTGTLTTSSPYIHMTDSVAAFGTLNPGDQGTGSFVFDVDSASPVPEIVDFYLILNGGDAKFVDTINFSLSIGDIRALPTGPDNHGYRIFEPYDDQNVVFNWIEIDPSQGGSGTAISLGDDETQTVNLPFTFTYYGENYSNVSICSNGWIALGSVSSASFSNRSLPNPSNPNAMIAGVWDDLNPSRGGSISYYYDADNHYFVVEYRDVPHFGSSSDRENFEIILYDPAYYTTPTGDGMIKIQYLTTPPQNDYTVGLEDANGLDGLTYYYDGNLDEHAFGISDSFALMITTAEQVGVSEGNVGLLRFDLLPASPNPFVRSTNISFVIPKSGKVKLAVYDISGRMIAKLVDGNLAAGRYTVRWRGVSSTGARVSSGIYFVRLESESGEKTRKIVLVR